MVVPVLTDVLAGSKDGAVTLGINFNGDVAPMVLLAFVLHVLPNGDLLLCRPPVDMGGVPDDGNPLPHQELVLNFQKESQFLPMVGSLNRKHHTISKLGML